MAVRGKYRSTFESEKLWAALLTTEAICFAVPEIDHLEQVDTRVVEDAPDERLVWQGTGTFSGIGTGIATIVVMDLQPLIAYTLQIDCKIGSFEVQAIAKIHLSADEPVGTLITWDANIVNVTTGRTEAMFEWTAGLMAQHFFKRIDQYLRVLSSDNPSGQESQLRRSCSQRKTAVVPDSTR